VAPVERENPAFVLYSDRDQITHGAHNDLRELVPSAGHQPDVWVEGAGYFLQEESGERVADAIVAFVYRT
jgi:haloalkane dehalogenase